MQRTTPSSPRPMPPSRQPHSNPPHSPPPQNNNHSPSGQERPSLLPPDSQYQHQHQDKEQTQDSIVHYQQERGADQNQGPPPSSQLVKYGDNPARYDPVPVDGGVVFDRVISLPPPPPPPSSGALQPYRRGQAQDQGQGQGHARVYYHESQDSDSRALHNQHYQDRNEDQGHDQIHQQGQYQQGQAPPRPQAEPQAQAQALPQHNRPQIEHQPTQPPSILPKPQTPRRNPFAAAPSSTSTLQPASSPIPQVTPDQRSNISTRPPTDPGAASRIKQSVSAEGTIYAHAPPHNGKTLVKRASKGINGGFKVPWSAGSPQRVEAQKQKEDTGNREEEEKVDPKQVAREPSADEQQIHQLMSAKKAVQAQARKEEAAQARAEAVKQAISPQNSITDPTRDEQQVNPSRDEVRVRSADNAPNVQQIQNTSTRAPTPRSAGQEVKQGGGKVQNVGPTKGQPVQSPTLAISTGQAPRSNPQGQGGLHQPSPKQSDQQSQQNQQHQGDQRPTNNLPPSRQVNSSRKVQSNGRAQPQQSQRPVGPPTRPSHHRNEQDHPHRQDDVFDDPPARGQGKAQPHTQGQGQSRVRGQNQGQQRSSPSPYRQEDDNTEQIGHRRDQEESNRGHGGHQDMNMDEDLDQGRDQYNKVQGHDYAHQENPTPKGGKGKRSRTREDVPDPTRSVSKRQKQNIDVGNGSSEIELEVKKEGEEDDASPFDAFAEIEKYDHVKELQGPWNEMMDEMVPFLDEWAEKYLSTTLDTIYSMYGCFYNMSTKNAESLEQGVEDILEYQATQNEIRQTLCDFREGVASISQRLVSAPGASKSRGGTPAQGGGR